MRASATLVIAALTVLAVSSCSAPISDPGAGESQTPGISASPTAGVAAAPVEEVFTPLVGGVLAAPQVVPATDGLAHLAYELVLTNVLGQPVTIDQVTVLGDGAPLLELSGDDLVTWMRPMGASERGRVLEPGQQGVVTLDVTVATAEVAPKELSHTIELSPQEAMPPMIKRPMQQTIAYTAVDQRPPIVIASPVRGDGWLDGNSCCAVTPHRSAINPVNGALYAPERFAIDFVQLNSAGQIFDGPIESLDSFAFYGADILAVGTGPIVSMGSDLPDEVPGAHPVGLELAQYGGNFIVQDIGDGHFAFYAHLQGKNPLGLKVGQQLSTGDLIGYLGNSGNTDMPHLHFHVMDSPLPLGSNGLPFLIDSFQFVGTTTEANLMACMESAISCGVDDASSVAMKAKSPLYGDVINTGN